MVIIVQICDMSEKCLRYVNFPNIWKCGPIVVAVVCNVALWGGARYQQTWVCDSEIRTKHSRLTFEVHNLWRITWLRWAGRQDRNSSANTRVFIHPCMSEYLLDAVLSKAKTWNCVWERMARLAIWVRCPAGQELSFSLNGGLSRMGSKLRLSSLKSPDPQNIRLFLINNQKAPDMPIVRLSDISNSELGGGQFPLNID